MHRSHFVHASGLRLNAPFEGVTQVSDEVAESLAAAAAGAWDDLVDFCVRKPVAFVVISGGIDLEDYLGLNGLLRFRRGLERLSDNGIDTLIALAPGDRRVRPILAGDPLAHVTIFPADRPTTVKIEREGRVVAYVCGQSGDGESDLDVAGFFAGAVDGSALVGVVACDLPILETLLQETTRKASYWAVGCAEQPSRRGFAPWIVESGSLQALRPSADATARGAMHVELDGAAVLAVNHLDVDRIRYATLVVTPQHGIADALLRHQIMDGLNRLRATHAGRGVLVDVELAGNARVGDDSASAQRATLDTLLATLREETAAWDPFVWCSRLSVQYSVRDGDASTAASRSVPGPLARAIIEESRALLSNPLHRSYLFANRFDSLMRCWTSELDSGDAEALIEEATRIALRHVGAEESGS